MSANDNSGFVAAATQPLATGELRGWCGLAITALALAGLLALFLAASRVPGSEQLIPWPQDFFHKALTVHVVLSIVVWYLAIFGALTQLAALSLPGRASVLARAGYVGLALTWAGTALLVVPPLLDRGDAHLNNYVPVITDRLFFIGLGLVFLGPLIAGLRLLVNLFRVQIKADPVVFGVSVALFVYLVALACFGLAYLRLGDLAPSAHFSEELFWGGGHILQFMNVALLLTAWFLLGSGWQGRAPVHTGVFRLSLGLVMLAVLPAPVIEVLMDGGREAFSLMKYALGLPVIAVAISMVMRARQAPSLPGHDPMFLSLALSVALFGLGGLLGFFVDGQDTRTPSHYHGVLGAVNIAMMGLFYGLFLPLMGRTLIFARRHRWQLWLYGCGQALQCLGLFLAGGYGAPRKVAGDAQGLEHLGAQIGMGLNGLGALIAVIGGVIFIVIVGRALMKSPTPDSGATS